MKMTKDECRKKAQEFLRNVINGDHDERKKQFREIGNLIDDIMVDHDRYEELEKETDRMIGILEDARQIIKDMFPECTPRDYDL